MTAPSCATCSAFKLERNKMGTCRAHPPRPILYGFQPPVMQGTQPQPIIFPHYPVVPENEWCREWQPKETN